MLNAYGIFSLLAYFYFTQKKIATFVELFSNCEGDGLIYATSLTENYEFQRVYKKGQSYPGRYVVLYYRNNHHKDLRYGITATKKIGKACKRNRARRLIFENMRLFFPNMKVGYDLVVVARPAILGADFFALGGELRKLLNKAGAFDVR